MGRYVITFRYYTHHTDYTIHLNNKSIIMDDIDLDVKLRELEESVKCRRERRKEQKKEMEEELEKSLKKESARSRDRTVVNESEKKSFACKSRGADAVNGNANGKLVSDQEEKYIRELCETEKRIRQLETTISDLNFELEKIDLAETQTGSGDKSIGMEIGSFASAGTGRVSTDI